MQKINKKGFTLVELVIVIAVIAILAGVLIGTFATVLESANKSKAMQEAKNTFENYLVALDYTTDAGVKASQNSYVIKQGEYYFAVKAGQFNATVHTTAQAAADAAKPDATTVTVVESAQSTAGSYFVKMTMPNNFYEYKVVV